MCVCNIPNLQLRLRLGVKVYHEESIKWKAVNISQLQQFAVCDAGVSRWLSGSLAPFANAEAWVRSLGREDALEAGMATHSSILAWRIPWTRAAWRATVHEVTMSQTQLSANACKCNLGPTLGASRYFE